MVDTFRNNFFETFIKEEKRKENKLKLLQKNCFHKYIEKNEYKICIKCEHTRILKNCVKKSIIN